ncbi:MAG: PilZ domain-containing protein [Candidatus Cloacimonetes bacterium]|nr:PilZ domain-containing protein [Candidatus Cloacimonadota bacterium]
MDINQRKYQRVMMQKNVQFYLADSDEEEVKLFDGLIENCDYGGLFIRTKKALPKGSVVKIDFKLETEDDDFPVITALAIVKWVKGETGLGINFIEFENIGARDFENWLKNLCDYLKEESSD